MDESIDAAWELLQHKKTSASAAPTDTYTLANELEESWAALRGVRPPLSALAVVAESRGFQDTTVWVVRYSAVPNEDDSWEVMLIKPVWSAKGAVQESTSGSVFKIPKDCVFTDPLKAAQAVLNLRDEFVRNERVNISQVQREMAEIQKKLETLHAGIAYGISIDEPVREALLKAKL